MVFQQVITIGVLGIGDGFGVATSCLGLNTMLDDFVRIIDDEWIDLRLL